MRPFVIELDELQNKILEMGGLVETSIHNSIRSLVERDDTLMVNIWESEERINQLDIQIDEFATRLLALHQPVLHDPEHGPSRQLKARLQKQSRAR